MMTKRMITVTNIAILIKKTKKMKLNHPWMWAIHRLKHLPVTYFVVMIARASVIRFIQNLKVMKHWLIQIHGVFKYTNHSALSSGLYFNIYKYFVGIVFSLCFGIYCPSRGWNRCLLLGVKGVCQSYILTPTRIRCIFLYDQLNSCQ